MNERPFNPHSNVTADGVLIRKGLRVWDNDLKVGTVVEDEWRSERGCCGEGEPGQTADFDGTTWFTDHELGRNLAKKSGCHCRHDHWFKVVRDPNEDGSGGGYVTMNGERLVTRFGGEAPPPGPDMPEYGIRSESEPTFRLVWVNGRLIREEL